MGFLFALTWTLIRHRSPIDAAIEIDRRFDLRERVASSLSLRPEEQSSEAGRAVVNDAAISQLVRGAAVEVVGEENVIDRWQTMGGEDFASVLAAVPGCFFFVGAKPPSPVGDHHNPVFELDERALPIGLEVMTRAARSFLLRSAG